MQKGFGVSHGIAIGPALIYDNTPVGLTGRKITANDVSDEKAGAEKAIADTQSELGRILANLDSVKDETMYDLIEIQIELACDPMLRGKVEQYIADSYHCAGDAILLASEGMAKQFEGFDNEYYRARASDIRDIGGRLAAHAFGVKRTDLSRLEQPVVIFARDLSPSETVTMDKEKVLGFVTELGSATSHTAILAKMLEIPAVVGVSGEIAADGETVIIDGGTGEVLTTPNDTEIAAYEIRKAEFMEKRARLKTLRDFPAITKDEHRVELCINISDPREAAKIEEAGANGVGLFRTEFLYMDAKDFPTEEEQFNAYKTAAVSAKGNPVIIRTLDIGGDKSLSYLSIPKEENPFLGYRAIRICLDRPELFKTQLRAILRAGAFGNLKIMFPMISSISQLKRAKQLIEDCKKELDGENIPYNSKIPVGIMVEIPCVAAAASLFAKDVDFFSIGTNDLCQYSLAIDRMNTKITGLYSHFNPGVLRLINTTIKAANEAGIMVGMCGEMASDPLAAPVLVGMGINELSVNPASVPYVKDTVRGLTVTQAKQITETVMAMDSATEIQNYLEGLQ